MSTSVQRAVMALLIFAAYADAVSAAANVRTIMSDKKSKFVFGSRPSHVHEVDGERIECNSAYCDHMDAHPLDQENQRPPWAKVPDDRK